MTTYALMPILRTCCKFSKKVSLSSTKSSNRIHVFSHLKCVQNIKLFFPSLHISASLPKLCISRISKSACLSTSATKIILKQCIEDPINDQNKHLSLLVSNATIQKFCDTYYALDKNEKQEVLIYICNNYGVEHDKVMNACTAFVKKGSSETENATYLLAENRLRSQLQPPYIHLLRLIGRLQGGVKFITDMRHDALSFATNLSSCDSNKLRDLSDQMKNILALWFSVGLLNLTRIDWETPADILEKIAKNEAVHQVRSWIDLKHRLGMDRRCYAFFHNSMPREPLLLLHIAITNEITEKITNIVNYSSNVSGADDNVFDRTTAIFYSITSTQKGLQGIDFGIHMIRSVVQELRASFPNLNQFSSLSPIPRFRSWLLGRLSPTVSEDSDVFMQCEIEQLQSYFEIDQKQSLNEYVRDTLKQNSLWKDEKLIAVLKSPLLRLCAQYLHEAKSRGFAFDPVANFHLRNGATLWRINWMADPSLKGFDQSLGIMVNYRYYLEEMEKNSKEYALNRTISVSSQVLDLKKTF